MSTTPPSKRSKRFQQEVERARAERIQKVVNQYYENNKDLSGIGPTLEQAKWLYNWNIEVTDTEGQANRSGERHETRS